MPAEAMNDAPQPTSSAHLLSARQFSAGAMSAKKAKYAPATPLQLRSPYQQQHAGASATARRRESLTTDTSPSQPPQDLASSLMQNRAAVATPSPVRSATSTPVRPVPHRAAGSACSSASKTPLHLAALAQTSGVVAVSSPTNSLRVNAASSPPPSLPSSRNSPVDPAMRQARPLRPSLPRLPLDIALDAPVASSAAVVMSTAPMPLLPDVDVSRRPSLPPPLPAPPPPPPPELGGNQGAEQVPSTPHTPEVRRKLAFDASQAVEVDDDDADAAAETFASFAPEVRDFRDGPAAAPSSMEDARKRVPKRRVMHVQSRYMQATPKKKNERSDTARTPNSNAGRRSGSVTPRSSAGRRSGSVTPRSSAGRRSGSVTPRSIAGQRRRASISSTDSESRKAQDLIGQLSRSTSRSTAEVRSLMGDTTSPSSSRRPSRASSKANLSRSASAASAKTPGRGRTVSVPSRVHAPDTHTPTARATTGTRTPTARATTNGTRTPTARTTSKRVPTRSTSTTTVTTPSRSASVTSLRSLRSTGSSARGNKENKTPSRGRVVASRIDTGRGLRSPRSSSGKDAAAPAASSTPMRRASTTSASATPSAVPSRNPAVRRVPVKRPAPVSTDLRKAALAPEASARSPNDDAVSTASSVSWSLASTQVSTATGRVAGSRIDSRANTYQDQVKQMALLQTTAMQWAYACSRAENTLLAQRKAALDQLFDKWSRCEELRDEIHQIPLDAERVIHADRLDTLLDAMSAGLEPVLELLDRVESRHVSLSQALLHMAQRMPVEGVVMETHAMLVALDKANAELDRLTTLFVDDLPIVRSVADALATLSQTVTSERSQLAMAVEQLAALERVDMHHRSLSIHLGQVTAETQRRRKQAA